MKRAYVILTVLTVIAIALGLIGAWILRSNFMTYFESFENDFGRWIVDADVPEDPNNPGQPVEWHVSRASNVPHSGQNSLEFFIDGRQDDGTAWIETKIEAGKRSHVKVSFWLYSEQESLNTLAAICAYVGVEDPEREEDFQVIGAANEVAGWKSYEYSTVLDSSSNGELWVAIGISVRWEAYLTYYIDDVEIEVS
ncbi:MAG: hypothetical protein QXU45_02130 [Candidatus Bathyarchaeia archaeon]